MIVGRGRQRQVTKFSWDVDKVNELGGKNYCGNQLGMGGATNWDHEEGPRRGGGWVGRAKDHEGVHEGEGVGGWVENPRFWVHVVLVRSLSAHEKLAQNVPSRYQ